MQLDNNQKITFIGLIVAILVGSSYYLYNHLLTPASPKEIIEAPTQEARSISEVIVYISGAVKYEGVYRVSSHSRVFDVIKLSGGQIPNADFSSINLAEVVKDGQKIVVPYIPSQNIAGSVGEQRLTGSGGKSAASQASDKKININSATEAELDTLPGVGLATAKQIVEARPFSKTEDLIKISRFGKSKYEKIKDKVCL